MAGIGNNLYPPVINTYMPAFLRTQSCRIYFSLSAYNSISEIANAQISVTNQNTNLSALNASTYPAEIKISSVSTDANITTDYKYYVTLSPSDMKNGTFELNQFYKVQIRFTGTNAESTGTSPTQAWLVNNQDYFSEWSRVCLIKGIETPTITMKGLSESSKTTLSSEVVDFVGTFSYTANSTIEKEYLKSYRIQLYDASNLNTTLADSDIIYTDTYASNQINYTLTYQLTDGTSYRAVLTYTTNNGYSAQKIYDFIVIASTLSRLNATITAEPIPAEGLMAVIIQGKDDSTFTGVITIRRSSHKTNFTIWEDVANVPISATPLSHIWYDNTAESGVWYKYCAQRRSGNGTRGLVIQTDDPAMLVLEDNYLLNKEQQLKLELDSDVSSYQINVSESMTVTIGSQYPFIRRNGNNYYKSFTLTGLIASVSDENELFTSKSKLYSSYTSNYAAYNEINGVNEYYDYVWEKTYRDEVMKFLYADTAKLFRSATEGNMIIKLTDISLTPKTELDRMIYSFSATAYEIAEPTMENLLKYNIRTLESAAYVINR